MATTIQLMSFAQFEQLPEQPGKQELVNGELITMPPPENRHSVVSKRIFRILLNILPEERVWGDHTGYRIGSGWIEPDASVSWPDQPHDSKYLVRAPMIAAEIVSPGEDIEEKLTLYFDEGAFEVWVINIRKNTMTVYRRSDHGIIRLTVESQYRCEVIGVTISLPELFA